jgi:hypothetical protein
LTYHAITGNKNRRSPQASHKNAMPLHYWITIVSEVKLIIWNFIFILLSGLNSTDDFVSASWFSCLCVSKFNSVVCWLTSSFLLSKYESTLLVHCSTDLRLHNGVIRVFSPFEQVHFIDIRFTIEMIHCHVNSKIKPKANILLVNNFNICYQLNIYIFLSKSCVYLFPKYINYILKSKKRNIN